MYVNCLGGWGAKGKTDKACFYSLGEGSVFRLLCGGRAPCSKNIDAGPIKWLPSETNFKKHCGRARSLVHRSMNK